MSTFFPFEGDNQQSYEYLGKSEEEYFADFIKTHPIRVDRLDFILRTFFSQGFNDGFFQGLQQGFGEGGEDKVNEIVGDMLEMKQFTIDQIAEATRMDKSEILEQQKRLEESEKKYKNRGKGGKNKKK